MATSGCSLALCTLHHKSVLGSHAASGQAYKTSTAAHLNLLLRRLLLLPQLALLPLQQLRCAMQLALHRCKQAASSTLGVAFCLAAFWLLPSLSSPWPQRTA